MTIYFFFFIRFSSIVILFPTGLPRVSGENVQRIVAPACPHTAQNGLLCGLRWFDERARKHTSQIKNKQRE